MKALCKPFKCLSFLSGSRRPPEYSPVDGPGSKPSQDDEEDEDDFFRDDDWGSSGNTPTAQVAKSQGVERNPTRETTTKRSSQSSASNSSGASAEKPVPKAPPVKKEVDFFSDLGMEPEYKAPRTRAAASPASEPVVVGRASAQATAQPTRAVSDLLADEDVTVGGGWGDDDL